MEILIVEDERPIAESLKKNFLAEGHHAVIVDDGEAALSSVLKIQYDVILLDWRLPRITGLQVCKKLREVGNKTPIILLTALNDITNKIEALNAGADDYITKPFSFDEVMARINAVLRRYTSNMTSVSFSDITLNLIDRTLDTPRGIVKLSEKEFDLLRFFLLNRGTILSRDQIREKVWDLKFTPQTNLVEVTVKNLRKKLEGNTKQKFIKSIYGEGYLFLAD
jgi:two-component system OmpR family response regulator